MSSLWTVRRSATDTKVSGLCGGIAQHWGVDPVLIRVAFAILALSGGIGLVLYLAGWLLVPVEGKGEAAVSDVLGGQARHWPRELWLVLVVVGCIVASAALKKIAPFGVGPVVVLALIWYFGYYRNRRGAGHCGRSGRAGQLPTQLQEPAPVQFYAHPGPATPFTDAAAAWQLRVEDAQSRRYASGAGSPGQRNAPVAEDLTEPDGLASDFSRAPGWGDRDAVPDGAFLATPDPVGLYQPDAPTGSTPVVPPRRSASRSARRLRLLALVAVGLTLSGLALADNLGADIPAPAYFAATLLVLGLTLVAAARFGRARGILPVALLVMLVTVGSTVGDPVTQGQGWQTAPVSYTAADLPRSDRRDAGELEVDLTQVSLTSDTTYTAHVGLGRLAVRAPSTANVVIKWSARTGALTLNDDDVKAGNDLTDVRPPDKIDPRKKTLTLNLSVDRGVVEVTR